MTGTIVQLVLAVLGGGGFGAVLTYVQARKRAPIDRDSAQAAASKEIAEAAGLLLEPLQSEVRRLDAAVSEYRAEATAAREEAAAARTEAAAARRESTAAREESKALRRLVSEAEDYIVDLHAKWPEHRKRDRPPMWRWLA